MMIDPSRMSGIPRPDPKIPPHTMTVRVLRGDFAHPAVGEEVVLTREGAPDVKQKLPDTSRATFAGLEAGATYVARCTAFGTTLSSQPVTIPDAPGVAMMLVFPKDEAQLRGEPDGVARVNPELPAGTVEVRVVDGEGSALAKVDVALAEAKKGTQEIAERHALTDDAGIARFEGLTVRPDGAVAVKALREGAKVSSSPFQLSKEHGTIVGLRSVATAEGLARLRIADRSHFIVELKEDNVEVVENLLLDNSTGAALDLGPAGLHLPLPEGAVGAAVPAMEEGAPPPPQTVEGDTLVWHGKIPAGPSELRVGFFLPIVDDSVTVRQKTPLAVENLLVITDHLDGIDVLGDKLEKTDKTMGQRSFLVVSGPGVPAGGELYFKITGLPHASTLWRDVVAGVAACILVWALIVGLRRPAAGTGGRVMAERRRLQLLDEVASLQTAPDKQQQRRREQLLRELEEVYRALDEA